MSRTRMISFMAAFVAAFSFGTAEDLYAACGVAPTGSCLTEDSTMAGVVVEHETTGGAPVRPNDTDSWDITATHSTTFGASPPGCICQDYTSQVTATVTWTGSAWSASCTGCAWPQGPILSVTACDASTRCPGTAYRLVARVKRTRFAICSANNAHLTSVLFQTSAVDDGIELTSQDVGGCSTVGAVSPTSQTFGGLDLAFGCNLNCTSVAGPLVTITY